MDKYLIISASNRPENRTLAFAKSCKKMLEERRLSVTLCSLEELIPTIDVNDLYNYEEGPFPPIVEKFINGVSKMIFIVPEYNGSYPGMLKVFIDAVPTRCFQGKKALLMGTSTGRAGNLRGMDHLAAVLNYVKVEVYSQKLPISSIDKLMVENKEVIDPSTLKAMEKHLDAFRAF
jgi:NAD(P)H-dependent FMN reductase